MTKKDSDRRRFKRYDKETELVISVNGRAYKCKTIDYSADGIGVVFVDTMPSLAPGNVVDIKIHELSIEFQGTAVWTRESKSGLRAGFKRVSNLEGSLGLFPLTDILIGLQRSTKTGILEIKSGSIHKKIYIENGDMRFATSNQADDRLSEFLLKSGKLSLQKYNKAQDMYREKKEKIGKILVDLGYLKAPDLLWAVRNQVEEIILSLFTIEEGAFQFKEGKLPTEEAIILKLSAANLIYRGVKRISSLHAIMQDFPSGDTLVSFSTNPLDLFQDISLDDDDKKILGCIHGTSTLKEIISSSHLSDFQTIKTVFALLSTRIIEIKREDETAPEISPEEVMGRHDEEIDTEFLEEVEDMYGKYEELGYYGVLGIEEGASNSEIKKAFFKLAKKFHPDRHFSLQSEDLKGKLNSIFTYMNEAYQTLSNGERKREYDSGLSGTPTGTAPNKQQTGADRARGIFNEGRSKMMKGHYVEAEKLFAEAIYLDSAEANYHYYYGLALSKIGNLKEAAKAIHNAIQVNPEKADFYAELGHVFFGLGFNRRAQSSFKKALELSPSNEAAMEGMKKVEELV